MARKIELYLLFRKSVLIYEADSVAPAIKIYENMAGLPRCATATFYKTRSLIITETLSLGIVSL
jgi:hypothetical protein